MEDLKPRVEKLLKTVSGIRVEFFYPAKFNKLPIVTFYEISNTEGLRADNKEWAQSCDIQIDIWADTAKETNKIGIMVNEVMQKDGFVRTFSMDAAPQDRVYHRTMRFQIKYYFEE